MKAIKVNTSSPYEVLLGKNLLANTGKYLKDLGITGKVAIITDNNVDKFYSDAVVDSLIKSGFAVFKHVIPHGEKSKNIRNYSAILDFLANNLFQRMDTIIALGGGVIGDISGFAAATFLRGIKYVQIPTTLLSLIDSSVGGKTAVNIKAGKNLVGAFHQPALVIADTDTLKTLPEAEIKNGKGELIKYGILMGGELWDLTEKGNFLSERALELCIDYKRQIVEQDEREGGLRKLLNLGHTFGHATEKLSNFKVPHGVAVALGVAIIAKAENKAKNISDESLNKIINTLQKNDMPIEPGYNHSQLISAALTDKKGESNHITLVTINNIGDCVLTKKLISELKEYLA